MEQPQVAQQQVDHAQPKLARHWLRAVPHTALSTAYPTPSRLRVLQWNLLADGLAQNGDFVNVDPHVLEWSYRRQLILQELAEADADIICLQELNNFGELEQALAGWGYAGTFLPKLDSPATRYNSPPDGVAIFWRTQRFTPAGVPHGGHFCRPGSSEQCSQGALQVLLREVGASGSSSDGEAAGRLLLVATTHLKAKEGAALDELRCAQMAQLLECVGQVLDVATSSKVCGADGSACCNGGSGNGYAGGNGSVLPARQLHAPPQPPPSRDTRLTAVPVILTGDFNATPESLPCKLLENHVWGFQSVWEVPVEDAGGAPPHGEFSTWKFRSGGESKRTIDHVWVTRPRDAQGGLQLVRRWAMLSEAEIGPAGLPSRAYPSDHISLLSEFEWL